MATSECFDAALDPGACSPPPPDGDPQGRVPCTSNAHCAEGEYCMLDEYLLCQGSGHCQPISNCGECQDSGTGACRLCACDGNTYPNVQTACRAGANAVVQGAGCGETVTIGAAGAGSDATPERTYVACATDSNCPDGSECCALTSRCYPSSDPEQCRLPPPGTTRACTASEQCDPHEYCAGDGCSGPGGCKSKTASEECGVTHELVCGCDGTTYTSPACAESRGVRVASEGECQDD
jgi:hypothetical protein